jgi:pyruvate formate lyase activating enzyme
VVVGYLIAGDGLDGFIGRSVLHGEWIDGFDISGGDPERVGDLIQVLEYIKRNGLKVQLATDGRNADVLEAVLDANLADRVLMAVRGPAALYNALTGAPLNEAQLEQSIALTARAPEYRFHTTVAPLVREDGAAAHLTPAEVGETARLIEAATGSKKHPYQLRPWDPGTTSDAALKSLEPLPASAMFKNRTAARRYMVMAEIAK